MVRNPHNAFLSGMLALLLCTAAPVGAEEAEVPRKSPDDITAEPPLANKRRVYVLHSGLHTILSDAWKNLAAEKLQDGLYQRGVAKNDLIVLENPFPTATWKNMFPVEGLSNFLSALEPGTRFSHDSYRRLHKALKAQGVGSKDEVIWIGHSAGGQIGLTMAHLGRNLWRFPDLMKETGPYHFEMVITLGTPVGSNLLPPEVKLRHYYSPQDRVVRWVSKLSPVVLLPLGQRFSKVPVDLRGDSIIRCFGAVEHPHWDIESRVLDRIVAETSRDYRPLWHSPLATPQIGLSLSQVLCQALEDQCRIALEDPPRDR